MSTLIVMIFSKPTGPLVNPEFDRKLGADFLRSVPDASGVYIFRDGEGEPIYIGKAKSLKRRLAQYRLAPSRKPYRKMRAIVRKAKSLDFLICPTELEALLLENQLIQQHRPSLNVAGAYSFLYPYLGLKVGDGEDTLARYFSLCYTTSPELLEAHGFQLFGAFRSRDAASEAYDALAFLLSFIGHHTPAKRKQYGDIAFTRIICFRQIDPKWSELFRIFFRGESSQFLNVVVLELLEKPGARQLASEIQTHLQNLKHFFAAEAQKLRVTLGKHGIEDSMIRQDVRDQLFLSAPRQKE